MSAHHRRDRRAPTGSEEMLGRVARGERVDGRLPEALAAARPRPLTHETDGEKAAVVALRAAAAARADGQPAPIAHIRHGSRRLARTMALAAGVVVVAGGGVAVAGAAGIGPSILGGHQAQAPGAGGASAHGTQSSGPLASPSAAGSLSGSLGLSPSMSAAALAELVAHCRAFEQLPVGDRGHALNDPEYAALVAAAHGKGHVKAYCDGLLSISSGPTPPAPSAAHPTRPSHPAPSAARTPHPHSSH